MVLFEIHPRFKGHFLNELRISFNTEFSKLYLHLLALFHIKDFVSYKKKWAQIPPQSHLRQRYCKI